MFSKEPKMVGWCHRERYRYYLDVDLKMNASVTHICSCSNARWHVTSVERSNRIHDGVQKSNRLSIIVAASQSEFHATVLNVND